MPSLAELRTKIKAIGSTRQITKAMKMVSGARMTRAQKQMQEAKRFSHDIQGLLAGVLSSADASNVTRKFLSNERPTPYSLTGRTQVIIISADKGLCGSFNTNLLRVAEDFLKRNKGAELDVYVIGNKAIDYLRRRKYTFAKEWRTIFNTLNAVKAEEIASDLLKGFVDNNCKASYVIYTRYRSVIKQEAAVERVLPLMLPKTSAAAIDYLCEPPAEEMLSALISLYIKAQTYSFMRESFFSELAARMAAMDNATRNAGNLIESVTLEMNKTRQSIITRELIEIVGTSEVMK